MLLKERLFIGVGLLIVVGGSIIYFATKPAPTRFKRSVLPEREPLVLPTLQSISSDEDEKVDWKLGIQDTASCFWINLLSSSSQSNTENAEDKKTVTCSSKNRQSNLQNSSKEEIVIIKK